MMYYPNMATQKSKIATPQIEEGVTNAAAEEMTPVSLLEHVISKLLKRFMFNERSKNITHLMNLQGFKRWHRYNMREDMEEMMEIKSFIIDHYYVMPEMDIEVIEDYVPSDLKSHLETWEDMDEKLIICLSKVKTDLIVPGNNHVEACLVQSILDRLYKEIKYLGRIKKELEDESYSAYCIYQMSHEIHECYKEKELEVQHMDIY